MGERRYISEEGDRRCIVWQLQKIYVDRNANSMCRTSCNLRW